MHSALSIAASLLVLTAAFSYLNHRYLRWPNTIGVMAIALVLSLAIVGLDAVGISAPRVQERALLSSIDFTDVLMEGMLSILLFAGSLHVDVGQLRRMGWQIAALAVVGTAVSTLVIGYGTWLMLGALGLGIPLVSCLLFGALISPTDPIAVLGVLQSAHAPAEVEATVAGESLLNDGVGVVLFTLLLDMLHSGTPPTLAEGLALFAREAVGGVAVGLAIGATVNAILATIDDYRVEVLITLATVVGGYALAHAIHVSGPLAMVAIGLLIGSHGRATAMSARTRDRLDVFWQLLDEILNGMLFVLIGLEFAVISSAPGGWLAAALAVGLSLLARFVVVGLPVLVWPDWFRLPPGSAWLLTWSGVRGGISVALSLALPPGPDRDVVLLLTYAVVVFSILVQGMTIGPLVARLQPSPGGAAGGHR